MKSEESLKQYRYALLDYDEQFEEGSCFKSKLDEDEVEGLAQVAAEHLDDAVKLDWEFWATEDGEDGEVDIELFKEDGSSLGVFEVQKTWLPYLNVTPKTKSVASTSQSQRQAVKPY